MSTHFAKVAQDIYQALGTTHADVARMLFSLEEENLQACLNEERAARVRQEGKETSPLAHMATYLPQILLLIDRARDGILMARRGYTICQIISDRLGEANTLKALGDLKVRVADLTGARHDYDAALPIYRAIQDRLGEANCRQGLGRLLVAEGKAEAAFVEFRTGLTMRIDVQDSLGIGASLGNMGRTANAVKKPALAVLLFEEALSIHKAIHDIFGQALDLRSQAEALWSLNETEGALVAWQQARAIFQRLQHPSAAQIEALFAKLAEQMPPEEFQALMAHLQTNGEELRTQAIARVEDMAREDQELQEIRSLLRQHKGGEKGEAGI